MSLLEELQSRIGLWDIVLISAGVYLMKWAFDLVTDPLRNIPGPFLARYTKLWTVVHYARGDFHMKNLELHQQYGSIVRIAPGQYSIDSPEAMKTIYGNGSDFKKNSWYSVWGSTDSAMVNLFMDTDPHRHSAFRRRVASTYSMSNLISYEPYVDECTALFVSKLTELASSGVTVDIGLWFQFYAFETVGMITFAKHLGFLDKGEDQSGIIGQLDFGNLYGSIMGFFHTWNRTVLGALTYFETESTGIGFVDNFVAKLIAKQKDLPPAAISADVNAPASFLDKFYTSLREGKMSAVDARTVANMNMAAGSDTTSITLSGILYHLLKNSNTIEKLREEIENAAREGRISDPITWKEAQGLPYLQAVIKEGLRVHPAVGFPLVRDVPEGGCEIAGRWFPGGTVVGINSWVAHFNTSVFGEDARLFRPERWLPPTTTSSFTASQPSSSQFGHARNSSITPLNAQKEAYFFAFGQGSRTCIGKNISLLEISKCIPQILRQFDFELDLSGSVGKGKSGKEEKVGGGEWKVVTHLFAKPRDFKVRVRSRNT